MHFHPYYTHKPFQYSHAFRLHRFLFNAHKQTSVNKSKHRILEETSCSDMPFEYMLRSRLQTTTGPREMSATVSKGSTLLRVLQRTPPAYPVLHRATEVFFFFFSFGAKGQMNRGTIKGRRLIEMESAPCLQGFLCLTEDIGIITIVRLRQSVKLMCNHRLRPDIKSEVRDILLSLARPVNSTGLIYHFVLAVSPRLIVMQQSVGALGHVMAWSTFYLKCGRQLLCLPVAFFSSSDLLPAYLIFIKS